MEARGCISSPEFEKAVKRVGEKPYSEIKSRVRARAAVALARLEATDHTACPKPRTKRDKRA